MSEHSCACVVCSEPIAAYSSLPQQGPTHYAIRFENCSGINGATVDGVEADKVFEAMSGESGWVLFYQLEPCLGPNYETVGPDGKPMMGRHGCRDHREGCAGIKFGRVEMLLKEPGR